MSVSIKSYSANDSAKLAKAILDLVEGKRTAPFSCTAHMTIHHGVYFKRWLITYVNPRLPDGGWAFTPRGRATQEWLNENISGKYSIQTSYVLFEDRGDALLCYLRFKDCTSVS